jgi:hypothetical protein
VRWAVFRTVLVTWIRVVMHTVRYFSAAIQGKRAQ